MNKQIITIKAFLEKNQFIIKKEDKIQNCREMFEYLANNCKELLVKYPKINKSIIEKLIQFHYEDVKQAGVWYRWIFNKRIPI